MARCCTKRVSVGVRCRGKLSTVSKKKSVKDSNRVGFVPCKGGRKRVKAGTRCMGKVNGHFQFKSC